ncbi:MAG: hypothetical protein JO010_02665 [Alphaproteobacteria bacterium]|nr:hypothetical protein [Alphaproteobacteria bacterium]
MAAAGAPVRGQGFATWASVTIVLSLAACESAPPAPSPLAEPPPVAEAPSPPPVAEPLPPRPARKPAPPAPMARIAPTEPSEPPPPIDPQRVIGLDQAEASQWLGEPGERTEAAPATIWRYTSQDCEVDIYFYLDLQHKVMRALHYEVRSNDIVDQRSERCFQQLVNERRERAGASAAYSPR